MTNQEFFQSNPTLETAFNEGKLICKGVVHTTSTGNAAVGFMQLVPRDLSGMSLGQKLNLIDQGRDTIYASSIMNISKSVAAKMGFNNPCVVEGHGIVVEDHIGLPENFNGNLTNHNVVMNPQSGLFPTIDGNPIVRVSQVFEGEPSSTLIKSNSEPISGQEAFKALMSEGLIEEELSIISLQKRCNIFVEQSVEEAMTANS